MAIFVLDFDPNIQVQNTEGWRTTPRTQARHRLEAAVRVKQEDPAQL